MYDPMKRLQLICTDQLGDAQSRPKCPLEVGAQQAPGLIVYNKNQRMPEGQKAGSKGRKLEVGFGNN